MKRTLALSAALGLAFAAQATTYYQNSYTFKFSDPNVNYQISNVYILEARENESYNYSYGFRLPGLQLTAPQGGTISDYANVKTAPATGALIIAETNELPGDATGQRHVLLGMAGDAAQLGANIAWGTLFTNTLEENIISGLENYVNPDPTISQQALQHLVDFAYGDARTGILDNLAQSHSAWFTPGQGQSFTLESWSNGAVVGSGTVNITTTPEPASLACLSVGALAFLKRRKKSL